MANDPRVEAARYIDAVLMTEAWEESGEEVIAALIDRYGWTHPDLAAPAPEATP